VENLTSLLIISETATELLKSAAPFLKQVGKLVISCRVIESQSNYLHIEAALRENPHLRGELLVHHRDVVMVLLNAPDKTIGFVHAAE
jgi:16S rRNA C967 or C1407 C5-methylase (RsmB/RsmF family)